MSGLDRLAELRGDDNDDEKDEATETKQGEDNADIAEHMQLYVPVTSGLEMISNNVTLIEKLKEKDRTIATEKSRKEIMAQLDHVMSETTSAGRQIKQTLDKIQQSNNKYKDSHGDSAKYRIMKNMYDTRIRRFHQVMNDYNAASHEFKNNLQDRSRRQLKIVGADISDEEIEKIVQSGQAQANNVIKQALVTANMRDVVKDIEDRHMDILKLEEQVLEVYELFKDLATLVDIQQESLDVIENRITNAKAYTEKGQISLEKAEVYSKKARQRQCCLLLILLCCIIAVLAPVLSGAFGSS